MYNQIQNRIILATEISDTILDIAAHNELDSQDVLLQVLYSTEYEYWFDLDDFYYELSYVYKVTEICKELQLTSPYPETRLGL